MDYFLGLLPYRKREYGEDEKDLKFTFKMETKNFDIEITVKKKDNSTLEDKDICEEIIIDEIKKN